MTTHKEIEHKTLENAFTWIPLDKRVSKFGGAMAPRRMETRSPLLWLANKDGELFLVNASTESLDNVEVKQGGFTSVDDATVNLTSNAKYHYTAVKPNVAVKIEHYDGFYDLDYILQVSIKVTSKQLGELYIISPAEKGGVKETVLLWDNGECGKNVTVEVITKA
jgi:hypothetical protein